MNKTKIEWLHWPDGKPGYSWNPIKGICPQRCWYCYARKIYKRFKKDQTITFEYKELRTPYDIKKPSRIFVCSTFEIFTDKIPIIYRDHIFAVIKDNPQHTFFILTKRPENIDRDMPENVILGTTVTCLNGDEENIQALYDARAKKKFVSLEPLMGEPSAVFPEIKNLDWLVVGRLTGIGNSKYSQGPWPVHFVWLKALVGRAKMDGVPVFLKNNLSGIWPGKLIQEFPAVTP